VKKLGIYIGIAFVYVGLERSAGAQSPQVDRVDLPRQELPRDPGPRSGAGVRFDVEVDPLAYLLRGHSLHIGLRVSRLRFDLGTFGLMVPEFIHGQKSFEDTASGYGAKADVYLFAPQSGLFVGVESSLTQQQITDEESDVRATFWAWSAGVRAGYQFELPAEFFIKPWIGIGHRFGHDDIEVAGRVFHQSPLLVFPTVHVGYVFP
jgi:hypothetical protein